MKEAEEIPSSLTKTLVQKKGPKNYLNMKNEK
jgi:hypothetical protein